MLSRKLQNRSGTLTVLSQRIDFSSAGQTAYFSGLLPPGIPTSLVDIQAGDGVTGSNSRQMMIEGWRGLLTESSTELFPKLNKNYLGWPGATCLSLDLRFQPLTLALQECDFPSVFGALFLNTDFDDEILRGFDLHLFHPGLIVTADAPQTAPGRREKYGLLIKRGFLFCGVVGQDSIWIARGLESRSPSPPAKPFVEPLVDSRQAMNVPAFCVDTPAPDVTVGWGGVLPVEGWMFDPLNPTRESTVVLELTDSETGAIHRVATVRTPRPDVASHFAGEHFLLCGFRAQISLYSLRPSSIYDLNLALVHENAIVARSPKLSRIRVTLHAFEQSARNGLAAKFLHGTGIEIGALQRSLSLVPGCEVRYIDRMPVSDLVAHYPELANLPIQAPDMIGDGEILKDIASGSQNFVAANHFFEHCQNPIQTLLNLGRVLLPGGILYMAVPDKRYTRDLARPVTAYEVLRQAFLDHRRGQPEVLFREWAESWEHLTGEPARARGQQLMEQDYSIHYNVWTLSDLLDFLLRAIAEFHLPFEITSVVSSENENILILTKCRSQIESS